MSEIALKRNSYALFNHKRFFLNDKKTRQQDFF
jgi:hypothetical protein